MKYHDELVIGLGSLFDLCVGDPPGWWHPVIGIGKLITFLERPLRRVFPETPNGERQAGKVLVSLVTLLTGGTAFGLIRGMEKVSKKGACLLEILLVGRLQALKSLKDESMLVKDALENAGLPEGRKMVSRIVGRDTEALSKEGVVKAAVETVAENASDGVVAPLFYTTLFGPVGGCVYKAINTMDSMVGYRNDRYENFGRAAARLDDAVNFVPSRLSALAMILAACLMPGYAGRDALKIWRRDRRKHKSPNAAQTEAAMAGALGVELAGPAVYFGKRVEKDTIGEKKRNIVPGDILKANTLLYGTAFVSGSVFLGIKTLIKNR